MLLFSALVAGSFSLGALAAPFVDPGALTALRFLLAACVVGLVAWARGALVRSSLRAGWRYGVLGALLAAYFVLMFEGLKTAPPVSAAAVFTLTPLMAAGFGWLVLRQKLTGRMARASPQWRAFTGPPLAGGPFHSGSLDVLHLLAHLLDQDLDVHGRARGLDVLRLR